MNITKGKILRYTLLPQVFPRFNNLITSGFSSLAYFIALVYRATNILPSNHAYLKHENIGKYTIRNVLTEASTHLAFDLKHIDQIIIFFAIIVGVFLLIVQFFLMLIAIFINPAAAQPAGIGEYFVTENPQDDLALRMLDSVFGVPGIFGSKEATETDFHQALHALFQLYSFGILVVAAVILVYLVFTIVAETAQTGTPFGKRYNHVWAPIRLVVGIGMLVPMAYGINAGQWITLHAAKLGSGFATTGWELFTTTLGPNQLINPEKLVVDIDVGSMRDFVAFMMIANTCYNSYEIKTQIHDIRAYLITQNGLDEAVPLADLVDFQAVLARAGEKNIIIRFGMEREDHADQQGKIFPYCGELTFQTARPYIDYGAGETRPQIKATDPITEAYFNLMEEMWYNHWEGMEDRTIEFINRRMTNAPNADPDTLYKTALLGSARQFIRDAIPEARTNLINELINNDNDNGKYGWAGAALWYNRIAAVNGQLVSTSFNTPKIKLMPAVMVNVCNKNQQNNKETSQTECYDPNLSRGQKTETGSTRDMSIAKVLRDMFDYWYKDPNDLTGNVFIDIVNAFLGTKGLFDMCANADIHPLAQLSALGKGLVDSAISNLGIAFGGGVSSIFAGLFGPSLSSASSFFSGLASTGLLIGFILYYIVPLLPFLYFLFAAGGWVKGIFEAMVGVPLWALAHLRIDGEGLPGDAAINGYFLIFEIFVRPILILFGLIASILIFAAMVKILNQTFTLIVSNVSGFSVEGADAAAGSCGNRAVGEPGTIEWLRGPVDELFFSVIYAIIVYMTGLSCFKLIDMIPNNILRWMGQGVQTFNDLGGEPAEGLLQKVAIGGSLMTQNLNIMSQGKSAAQGIANSNLVKGMFN